MMNDIISKIRRGLKKPPKVIFHKIIDEIKLFSGQFITPYRIKNFTKEQLLKNTEAKSIQELWEFLALQSYPASQTFFVAPQQYNDVCPNDYSRILNSAQRALSKEINLLGTGWIYLGDKIDWHKDYKSNIRWKPQYITKISYSTPHNSSDVKIPWEISRMQWLIPVGQAYLLTNDEKYAIFAKEILVDWISENDYAQSVNWACTMEVAIRIFTFTWLFKVFHKSNAWEETHFKYLFLRNLYLHGDFTERYIEKSDINGNHFTADAAALVMCGLFFERGKNPSRWAEKGWIFLQEEIIKQVFSDGVDYEASVPYHRLVLELFFYPAYYRILKKLAISNTYLDRLKAMASFAVAYSRPDGTIPLWGDADDARVLPFRDNAINDHRYLCAMVGFAFEDDGLISYFSGEKQEIFWLFGIEKVVRYNFQPITQINSRAFTEGGFYIMRDSVNHVFIDCGPIGLAGRGGHGHNDLLSFEAMLAGKLLITDSGQYLYTADYIERNNFRSTAYHNTPQIDGEEINRFIRWDSLWNLHNDAKYKVNHWETNEKYSSFIGSHNGYERLSIPTLIKRTFVLNHNDNTLLVEDNIESNGEHCITIPFHINPLAKISCSTSNIEFEINGQKFGLKFFSLQKWDFKILEHRQSISYGVVLKNYKIVFMGKFKSSKIQFFFHPIPQFNENEIQPYIKKVYSELGFN